MRIILSNYRYFLSGGPENYLFSCKRLLEKNGIDIVPFSVQSVKNVKTRWEKYFLTPLSRKEFTYFHEYSKDIRTMLKVIERSFYSPEGYSKARKIAKFIKPDLVYSLHFLNKMSPSVIDGFKSLNIPVVVRLSDFSMICPQGLLLNNGKKCEACIKGGLIQCVRNKCIQSSFSGSLIKYISWKFHRLIGVQSRIDAFVCPSKFTMEKYIQAGFSKKKLFHIPTFIDIPKRKPDYGYGKYILYFGRIVAEKGVELLLEAYKYIDEPKPDLILIGGTKNSEYYKFIKNKYSHFAIFKKFTKKQELVKYIKGALFVVIPSVCYDNMPNVLLEAYAYGKSVIASNSGGFPDFVEENKTGILFKNNDITSLKEKLEWAINNKKQMIDMGKNARIYAEIEFAPKIHLQKIMKLFEAITEKDLCGLKDNE